MNTQYVSGYTRLRQLADLTGPFFHTSAVRLLLKCSVDAVDVYLSRWQKAGMIQRLGPRAGVFMNTLYPGWRNHVEQAVASIYPGAVVIGTAVIHEKGYTSQIPRRKSIIVPNKGPSIDSALGFDIDPVGIRKYLYFAGGAEPTVGVLPRASTTRSLEYALVVERHLNPDDIDYDEIAINEPQSESDAAIELYR